MSTSRSTLKVVSAIVLGGGIGWLVGRLPRQAEEYQPAQSATSAPRSTPREVGGREDGEKGFAALLRELERQTLGGDALHSIERMSAAELRALLLTSAESQKNLTTQETRERFLQLVQAAAAEFYRREGPESLAWAESSDSRNAFTYLLAAAARNEPDFAWQWVDRYKAIYGQRLPLDITRAAHHGAQERGAKDLGEVDKLYGEFVEPRPPGYPSGFDFESYFAKNTSNMGNRSAMRYLGGSDPVQAEKMLLKGIEEGREGWAYIAGAALDGRAGIVGESEAARWIRDLLPKVPESERAEFIDGLVRSELPDLRAETLVRNLPDDAGLLVAVSLNKNLSNTGSGLVALKAMDSESQRVAALTQTLKDLGWPTPEGDADRSGTVKRLTGLMDAAGISDQGQTTLKRMVEKPQ